MAALCTISRVDHRSRKSNAKPLSSCTALQGAALRTRCEIDASLRMQVECKLRTDGIATCVVQGLLGAPSAAMSFPLSASLRMRAHLQPRHWLLLLLVTSCFIGRTTGRTPLEEDELVTINRFAARSCGGSDDRPGSIMTALGTCASNSAIACPSIEVENSDTVGGYIPGTAPPREFRCMAVCCRAYFALEKCTQRCSRYERAGSGGSSSSGGDDGSSESSAAGTAHGVFQIVSF